jgi:peptide subunit release factor 1 (eRF1)
VETRLYYGLPQIKHLLFALDQYKKYLVILFSGADARLLEVFLTRTTEELRVETDHELARRFGRKAKTLAADRRDAEFERRFVREAATEINQYFLDHPDFERLVFGGNLKQAHAVRSALHPAAKELVVAVEPIDFKLPDDEIARMVKRIAGHYEQEHDVAVVDDLVTRYNRKGSATLEKQGVETALSQGRVKTLVIPYPIDKEDFDPLIVEATVHGAGIEFVYGEGADKLNEFGGIGATLYYSGS